MIGCMSESRSGAAEYRIEHDSMGEVQVPAEALWAAQTQRASANRLSGETMPREVIVALARIKAEAAAANAELGVIDADMAQAIGEAAREVSSNTSLSMCSRPGRGPRQT
jgi:fumarate hydratase, class II